MQVLALIQFEKRSNNSCSTAVLGLATIFRFCPVALLEASTNPLSIVSSDHTYDPLIISVCYNLKFWNLYCMYIENILNPILCERFGDISVSWIHPNFMHCFILHLSIFKSLAKGVCYETWSGGNQRSQEWLVPLYDWRGTSIWSGM